MSAIQPLFSFIGIDLDDLSYEEKILLDLELLVRICNEIKEYQREQYKNYFQLMKFTADRENEMLESNLLNFIIRDIIATEEYSILGIACYTDTPEEVLQEIIEGRNTSPSATLLRRLIELHLSVRRELYLSIKKRIAAEYLR